MVAYTKLIERTAGSNSVGRSTPNSIVTGMDYLRAHHPVDPCDCDYVELALQIEDMGLLNMDLPFILKGLADTEGVTWHYLRGLKKACLEFRPKVRSIESTPRLIGELLKVCIREFDIINQEVWQESHAANLAMLETAVYLLVHYSPHEGRQWLEAIYQD